LHIFHYTEIFVAENGISIWRVQRFTEIAAIGWSQG